MKTYICILLAFVLAALPTMGQDQQTVTISIPMVFGEVQIPSGLPRDIQEQIQIVIASIPQDEFLSWTEAIVFVVIVVVVGVILYCLWRCAQMIPEPQPAPPPDDPAFADKPHMLVYNLTPAQTCELQCCTSLPQKGTSIEWLTLCNLSEITGDMVLHVPESDTIFFRLEAR